MTIILGIDPGSRVTGYGLIEVNSMREIRYLDSGCIRTSSSNLCDRLVEIFHGMHEILGAFSPEEAAFEQVFLKDNPNTALKLGHARGAAMVACSTQHIPIYEYATRFIKQAVVGYGNAQKKQVQHMVTQLLQLNKAPSMDAADALATAICHQHMRKRGLR